MVWSWTWKELDGWVVGRPCLTFSHELFLWALTIKNRLMTWSASAPQWRESGGVIGEPTYIYPPAFQILGAHGHGVFQQANQLSPRIWADTQGGQDLSGQMIDAAAIAVCEQLGYIIVRGTDNAFYMKRGVRSTRVAHSFDWSGYEPIPGGGLFPSPPSITLRDAPSYLEVAARGMDNRIWHNQFNGARWDGWSPVGLLRAPFGPAVTALDDYTVLLFAPGDDLKPRLSMWKSGSWDGWLQLANAPLVYSDMATLSTGPRSVAVAYRGANGTVHLGQGTRNP